MVGRLDMRHKQVLLGRTQEARGCSEGGKKLMGASALLIERDVLCARMKLDSTVILEGKRLLAEASVVNIMLYLPEK